MKAQVTIMPKEGILDPQGVTVGKALADLGIKGVSEVRIGKFVEIEMPKLTRDKAQAVATEACDKLLANPNIEGYTFTLVDGG